MPNWCENTLIVSGDKETILKFKEQAMVLDGERKTDLSLNNFVPMPNEFEGIVTGGRTIDGVQVNKWRVVDGKEVVIPQEELDELTKKYGANNWYDWAYSEWGTKWDVDATLFEEDESTLKYDFDSAWSPPSAWLEKVALMFPSLQFELSYREPGVGFQGTITAQNDMFMDEPEEFEPDEEWEDEE